MGFAGTKRSVYSSEKVREMRSERKTRKASVPGKTDAEYQQALGDLIGAGHLRLVGFNKMETEKTQDTTPLGQSLGMGNNIWITHKLEFGSYLQTDREGVRPHLEGYLSSGHPNDPKFKLKGWINEDGSVRIELVK
jgi:hypothetical protein